MTTDTTTTETATTELSRLESTAMTATIWTIAAYGSSQVLRVVNSLILTRLLHPAAFGLMTLVSTLIVGITLLSDIGLQPSVIQSKRGDDPVFLNTAWTLQILRGGVLWIAALVLAWPLALFYHDRQLLAVFPVLALTTIFSGFNSTSLLTLSRHMGVRRLFALEFSTQIFTLLVTVTWAWFSPTVWALVGGTVAACIYRMVLSHTRIFIPGIRNRLCWDPESLRSIIHFGKWILIGTGFFFFASQADRLILGKLVSLSLLGVYGIAFSISDIPRQVILAFSSRVGYPFIAKIVHLPQVEFRATFLRYRFYVLLAGGVLLSLMANWGSLVILKLYDSRYHDASWMVPILALGLWHTLLYTTTSPVLFSLGKSQYNAYGNAAYCVAMVSGMPLGFHFYGMVGAVVVVAAGDFPLYLVTQYGATREGIRPVWQDLQTTVVFLALLAAGFFLRRATG